MKRTVIVGLVIVALVATVLALRWLYDAREARLLRAALANADVKSCPRAVSLGDRCGRCITVFCCREIDACYGMDDCIDLNDCTVNCGEEEEENEKFSKPECRHVCAKKHPASVEAFNEWDDCSLSHCASVCPRPSRD